MQHKYRHAPIIGWSRKEMIWLEAALTLPAYDFLLALEDIASMSGRTVSAVAAKARAIRNSTAPKPPKMAVAAMAPMRQLTKADLMAGRVLRQNA